MSKKINISIPNKIRPNLITLFHDYLHRKAKEPNSSLGGNGEYLWDYDEYEDLAAYWDKVYPGWDDCLDEGDVIFPPRNNSNIIVLNTKLKKGKKKDTTYGDFYGQSEREERWNKKNKHKHNKGKKARLFNINVPYSGEEEDLDNVDIDFITPDYNSDSKQIWFYPDYHCKDDKLEFNSLKEFSDYCDSMGYFVEKEVAKDISFRYESHCCLNPESERIGLLEVMSEHSYGEMFYEACEECELEG